MTFLRIHIYKISAIPNINLQNKTSENYSEKHRLSSEKERKKDRYVISSIYEKEMEDKEFKAKSINDPRMVMQCCIKPTTWQLTFCKS